MNKGALCISLDFEKYWGLHDVIDIHQHPTRFKPVSETVDRLLVLFNKYDIHCTWATVGMLNFESVDELAANTKDLSVPYANQNYSPFPIDKHRLESIDPENFQGVNEINKILEAPNQELASHTFSHYYCLEKGQTEVTFKQDIDLFNTHVKTNVNSIVFPRNQVNEQCLQLCSEADITAYRGNQNNRFWKNSDYGNESLVKKIGRTLDAYLKISKDSLIPWSDLKPQPDYPLNIPASRFLKPYRFSGFIESLKLKRITKQMTKAAKQNMIYHLWWHPHNFSTHPNENFEQLEHILKHYQNLKQRYGFQSLNMEEIHQTVA